MTERDPAPDCNPALGFDLDFAALYERPGLLAVDAAFRDTLADADSALAGRLEAARSAPDAVAAESEAALLLELAPHLDAFLTALFPLGTARDDLAAACAAWEPVLAAKKAFVQRRAAKAMPAEEAAALDGDALRAELEAALGRTYEPRALAAALADWQADPDTHAAPLEAAIRYAAWAVHSPAGRHRHRADPLFKLPRRDDPAHLVPVVPTRQDGVDCLALPPGFRRPRDGFALTDAGAGEGHAAGEMGYCILCQHQGRDSCSKGMRDRDSGAFRRSALGPELGGCPLEERISEMIESKRAGHHLAALAVAVVDNPMLAGTGHRICNDCMKACVYRNNDRTPVDVPQVETRILKDVLALPWGFEVYSLLTRWNPLDLRRPLPRPESGCKVLVAGLGPAGYTLAHHLLQEGHGVMAVDGLKIEPLPPEISGVTPTGQPVPFRPVTDVADLWEPLDSRTMAGFGGVAEYGITVRWDKNFLKLIRLLLERRRSFAMAGGVRLGGTLTPADALRAGFDHVALCLGAGRPTVLEMENRLAMGVRQASDFLMALQLTGAARADALANLQIRLPVAVIGGGLTAIDTATEALAYYPVQVERFLQRYEILAAEMGPEQVEAAWTPDEQAVADTFLTHARAIRAERAAARAAGRGPDIAGLLEAWGGATVVYRQRLIDSPSYTRNPEEVEKALEEGVRFAELLAPEAVEVDGDRRATGLRLRPQTRDAKGGLHPAGDPVVLPARSVLVAAGTRPNTVLAREWPDSVSVAGRYIRAVDMDGTPVEPEARNKPAHAYVLAETGLEAGRISFFGDLHPGFAGNVVSAMASAKRGYPVVDAALRRHGPSGVPFVSVRDHLADLVRATVWSVERLGPEIIEVVIRAPAQAAAFRPGQFFRLQNFERNARLAEGTRLAMEGVALTGAWVDAERGLIALIVLEMGGSSSLCRLLEPGEPVVLMGPTGAPTEIPEGETVILAGGGLGNAVLFSIGRALRAADNRVLYFAAYKTLESRFRVPEIEAAADSVIWCCDEAPGFTPGRPGDHTFAGNVVEAMRAYADGTLGPPAIPLGEADRLIAIGSDRMMAAVAAARHGVLADVLKPGHVAVGSINSPMQCMMKEICAQCLQAHRDPETGEETVVFSCFNQDQPLDWVDFPCLNDRLKQDGVQEKLTARWINRVLSLEDSRED